MERRTSKQDSKNSTLLTSQPVKVINDFRNFLATGNIINFAVGILVGNALSSVIQAFISDLFDPIVSKIFGRSVLLSEQKLTLGNGDLVISWGHFVSQLINFLITAFAVYIVIRVMQKTLMKETDEEGLNPDEVQGQILSELKLNNRLLKRSMELDKKEQELAATEADLKRREAIISVEKRFTDPQK